MIAHMPMDVGLLTPPVVIRRLGFPYSELCASDVQNKPFQIQLFKHAAIQPVIIKASDPECEQEKKYRFSESAPLQIAAKFRAIAASAITIPYTCRPLQHTFLTQNSTDTAIY